MNNILKIGIKCVGCRSCEQSCPVSCIKLRENQEGFIYPTIDTDLCIECGKCINACPVEKKGLHINKPLEVWAWKNKNSVDLMRSASGGAADSATRVVLQTGGIVYGAAYDDQLVVRHIRVENEEERYRLQSSKYVQSNLDNTYSLVKRDLLDGKCVLYTGTPCQISGLYAYLGGNKNNLYTIDLICHGVPSPKFFKKYVDYQQKQMGEKVISYNFRSKDKRGWGTQYLLKTKTKTKALTLDRYGKHFMDGDCYRECCYQCEYAKINRVGDLTVGDFWGIAKSHPDFYSTKGVSSVFVNTIKGKKIFEKMKEYAEIEVATLEEAMVKQRNLVKASERTISRNSFYNEIDNENFIEHISVGIQIKERIKVILPKGLIERIKKYK